MHTVEAPKNPRWQRPQNLCMIPVAGSFESGVEGASLQHNHNERGMNMTHLVEARVDMYEVTADLHTDGSLHDVTFWEYNNDGEIHQVRAMDIDLSDHRRLLAKLNDVIFEEELNAKRPDPMSLSHERSER